jgi:hypothetical protein
MIVRNDIIKLGYLMVKMIVGSGNNRGQMPVIYYQEQSMGNYYSE